MRTAIALAVIALIAGAALAEPILNWQEHVYYYMRDRNAGATNISMDSASTDTTVTIAIAPGTRLGSSVKASHTDDVMDFKCVLEAAIIDGQWKRWDSVTITDTTRWFVLWDTLSDGTPAPLHFKYVRMILDPVDAQYVPADTIEVEITLIGNQK